MAKNITLMGANYPDVPAVQLSQTGGGTATFIEESELGNTHVWVGTCNTAAATRDKAVTITGVTEYRTGDMFVITFTNAQDYNGGPRLNVNGLGVKNIRRVTGSNAARYQWAAGETLAMVYNGTYMLLLNNSYATTTYYGLTRLGSSLTSTSSSLAATTGAVNNALNMLTEMPPYSADQTYSIGDRVRYSTGMYECNTAITEAEAWNAAHWTQLPALQTQIDTLDSKIPEVIDNLNSDSSTDALSAKQGKVLNSNLTSISGDIVRLQYFEVVTATSLETVKTGLIALASSIDSAEYRPVTFVPSFTGSKLTNGATYRGFLYNIYNPSGTALYFTCMVSSNVGDIVILAYSDGIWAINKCAMEA